MFRSMREGCISLSDVGLLPPANVELAPRSSDVIFLPEMPKTV
jgi:hypothetical protein